jgi:hypothetical protein
MKDSVSLVRDIVSKTHEEVILLLKEAEEKLRKIRRND